MVHNHSSEVIEAATRVGKPGARKVVEQVVGHVETIQWKLYKGVQLGAGVSCPPKSLDVQAKDIGKPSDSELFRARLLRLTTVAVEALRIRKLLPLDKLLQAVVDVAVGLLFVVLRLPHRARVGLRYVDGEVKERVVLL